MVLSFKRSSEDIPPEVDKVMHSLKKAKASESDSIHGPAVAGIFQPHRDQ